MPKTLDDLDADLKAAGVTNFSAREITANRVGKRRVYIVPQGNHYRNMIGAAVLAQKMRDLWGGALVVSTGYRPNDSKKSAHYRAKAIDLDLPRKQQTRENRDRLYFMVARDWMQPKSEGGHWGGMGLYRTPLGRLHVDIARPRFWKASRVHAYFKRIRAGEPLPERRDRGT